MDESLDSWFKREIVAHEAALVRYLYRTWPNPDEVPDLRQEIYVRIYEAAGKSRPTGFVKTFLFTAARNLMTDRIRRRRIVSIRAVGDLEALNVMVDGISPEQKVSAQQELRRVAEAIDLLPDKCREAVWLRRVADLPQKEVALRLGITEKTVEKHLARGMKILTAAIFGSDAGGAGELQSRGLDPDEKEHGSR
jgi:RNA polymerase sigma factor (sigma-70 family)